MKTVADSPPARIELPQDNPAKPAKQANADISLSSLEHELTGLEAAFAELERLKAIACRSSEGV